MANDFDNLDLSSLPSMPEVLVRLLKELNGENLNITGLKRIISTDPVLVLRIMTIVNSPLYRRRQEMTSIDQAINLLGIKLIKVISISVSLQQFVGNMPSINSEELGKFWTHSLSTAIIARLLAEAMNYPEPEEAYIVGLIHDIGHMVMLALRPDDFRECSKGVMDESLIVDNELIVFGTTHAEIAAKLFEQCNLDPFLLDAIRHHHSSVEKISNAPELVKLLYMANALSCISNAYNHPALALSRSLLGMTAEEVMKICIDAQGQVVDSAMALGVPVIVEPKEGYTRFSSNEPKTHGDVIKVELAKEISNSTLINHAQEGFDISADENQLLLSILQTATVLFEPRQIFMFEWDSESNLISGKPLADQPESLRRIRFPLELNKSVIADALLWNTTRKAEPRSDSIVDEQITRLLGTQSMLCVPIASSDFMYGAMVLGYSTAITQRVETKFNLMNAFASIAANSIRKFREEMKSLNAEDTSEIDEYKLNVRKIIHEVNNPLAIMKNYLRVLDIKLSRKLDEPVTEIKVLNEEIDRVSNIFRQLSATSEKKQPSSIGDVDVNNIAKNVVELFDKSTLPESHIKFETRFDKNLHAIQSNADSIKQVLINLIKNSVEALSEGGTITVATSAIKKGDSNFLTIVVSDTGPGVPEQIRDKLFSAVESTKGTGNAGLGLSIVAKLVKDLGGNVMYRPALGSGAMFIVALPYRQSSQSDNSASISPQ